MFDNVYHILASKVTPTKRSSLFVTRAEDSLLFSCFAGHRSIEGSFDDIEALGGVALHLSADMRFAARDNDDADERFGVVTICSEVEGPDVRREVAHVATFEGSALAPGVEGTPTPRMGRGRCAMPRTGHRRRFENVSPG